MAKIIARNKKVFGVAINDYPYPVCMDNGVVIKAYRDWYNMLARCYGNNKEESYKNCVVSDEWLFSSNFIKWHNDNYVDGWQLDKDILVKGNKVYSPETCCFVPHEINSLLTKRQNDRGKYPIGVCKSTNRNGYIAKVWMLDGFVKKKCFKTPYDAFLAYKNSKEQYIKHIANKFKGIINLKVYNALCNYKVEITD